MGLEILKTKNIIIGICQKGTKGVCKIQMTYTNKKVTRVLTVDLSKRLPDINKYSTVPKDLERYGRCAILRNGSFWFGEVNTSHPPSTQEGFYWAIYGSVLYFSPRGSLYNWEEKITDELIRFVSVKTGLKRRYSQFRIKPER